MTRRARLVLAGSTAVTVLAALAVAMVAHHHRVATSTTVTNQQQPSPQVRDEITAVAEIAATRALACQPTHPTALATTGAPHQWCGAFTVTRHQTGCTSVSRCQVELIGTFTTPQASTVIAMTVDVQPNAIGGWRVVAVSS